MYRKVYRHLILGMFLVGLPTLEKDKYKCKYKYEYNYNVRGLYRDLMLGVLAGGLPAPDCFQFVSH